jgi:hypothetical protein
VALAAAPDEDRNPHAALLHLLFLNEESWFFILIDLES